ncbi:MAG: molybdopterin-dependent oxidoreductase [Planctomycetaceae bacterium]|nr:molybdopterin-dependent oxidoreductase [Planctomycetaceae bacterium]
MSAQSALRIDGLVAHPLELNYDALAAMDADAQVADVSRFDPARKGDAVRLSALLQLAGVKPEGDYLTLHASLDDFHASVPLAEVRERGLLIYRLDGEPLPRQSGGPIRFLIPDYAACKTAEIDDCANVKFVDRIEITRGRGQDNRPHDEQEHAELHRRQGPG